MSYHINSEPPSKNQIDRLIKFLKEYPDLIESKQENKNIENDSKKVLLWHQLTSILNTIGPAVKKFGQWQRYWVDINLKVKTMCEMPNDSGTGMKLVCLPHMCAAEKAVFEFLLSEETSKNVVENLPPENNVSNSKILDECLNICLESGNDFPITLQQKKVIKDFLDEHPVMRCRPVNEDLSIISRALWEDLTFKLNSMGGAVKSMPNWRRFGTLVYEELHTQINAENLNDNLNDNCNDNHNDKSDSDSSDGRLKSSLDPDSDNAVTYEQKRVMNDFLNKHPVMRGRPINEDLSIASRCLWDDLTFELNSMKGAVKSMPKWRRFQSEEYRKEKKKCLNKHPKRKKIEQRYQIPSLRQKKLIFEFIKQNPEMTSIETKNMAMLSALWMKLACKLNGMGEAVKTPNSWRDYWKTVIYIPEFDQSDQPLNGADTCGSKTDNENIVESKANSDIEWLEPISDNESHSDISAQTSRTTGETNGETGIKKKDLDLLTKRLLAIEKSRKENDEKISKALLEQAQAIKTLASSVNDVTTVLKHILDKLK